MTHTRLMTVLLASALLWPATTNAFGRDSDGSRMQARPLALNSTAKDRLSPPNDSVDWRYIRLSAAADVTVTVKTSAKGAAVNVSVTDAMGKSLVRGRSKDGTYTTRRRLDPGLYYISVASAQAVGYQLSVR